MGVGEAQVVCVLSHVYIDDEGYKDGKLIGVFSSQEDAETAKLKYQKLPGFRDYSNNFLIEELVVDQETKESLGRFLYSKIQSK